MTNDINWDKTACKLPPTKWSAEQWLGELIDGQYQIGIEPEKDILGKGTFSVVYRARQVEGFHRWVAIKRLRGHIFDAETVKRECQLVQTARSIFTISVYSSGVHACSGGTQEEPWFSMELIKEPITLSKYISTYRPSRKARMRLMILICLAVLDIHKKSIIHGDLKPNNILIDRNSMFATIPKIIDFGISHSMYYYEEQQYGYGTPRYRSKKQEGKERATTLCDLHALKVIKKEIMSSAGRCSGLPATREEDTFDLLIELAEDLHLDLEGKTMCVDRYIEQNIKLQNFIRNLNIFGVN